MKGNIPFSFDIDTILQSNKRTKHCKENQDCNNISRMDSTIQTINKINNEYKKLYNSFNVLVDNKVFNEVDVQYCMQKLNDKLKKYYDNFVEIINNLNLNLVK